MPILLIDRGEREVINFYKEGVFENDCLPTYFPPIHLQNTYTNAEKLLQAAEELAHTGECNPEEIYNVAQTLDTHIARFATRVQKRHRLLNMAVLFYTHEKEVSYSCGEA